MKSTLTMCSNGWTYFLWHFWVRYDKNRYKISFFLKIFFSLQLSIKNISVHGIGSALFTRHWFSIRFQLSCWLCSILIAQKCRCVPERWHNWPTMPEPKLVTQAGPLKFRLFYWSEVHKQCKFVVLRQWRP